MKRIISLILAVLVISAMSVVTFANDLEGAYEILGTPSKTEVSVGDTFTYSITLAETDADALTMCTDSATWTIELVYDADAFELSGAPALGYGFTLDNTFSSASENSYSAVIECSTYETTFSKETALLTFTFTVKAGATDPDPFSVNAELFDLDSFNNLTLGENLTAKLTAVSIAGGEEVFETGVEGTASTSTVAFFGKNPTNAPLAAGTYGVWFGGVKYPAGINPDTNCGIGEKFVVRFTVDPSKPYSAIPKGTYTYKVYYNDGANMTESTVTIE